MVVEAGYYQISERTAPIVFGMAGVHPDSNMGSRRFTRRQTLETAGVAVLGGVLGMASSAVAKREWRRVESPTDKTLTGVEYSSNGPYASGGGGDIIHRDGGSWVRVVDDGPTGQSKTLNGAALTDDLDAYWVVGNSGVVGEYDTAGGTLHDHSQPLGISAEFTSVSVRGGVGDERLYIGKSSGEVLVGVRNSDGGFDWMLTDTGSGYAVQAVDFTFGRKEGFVSLGGAEVYGTDDGGNSWFRVGVPDGQTSYTAILGDPGSTPKRVYVGGGGGRIWRRDCDCDVWTPTEADTKRVYSLESNNKGERSLGAGGSGRIYRKADSTDGAGWKVTDTSTGNALLAAAPADTGSRVDIAVGKSGTIMEQ